MEKTITCQHCGYTWTTNSEMMFVSCPNCMQKTKVTKLNSDKIKEDKNEITRL